MVSLCPETSADKWPFLWGNAGADRGPPGPKVRERLRACISPLTCLLARTCSGYLTFCVATRNVWRVRQVWKLLNGLCDSILCLRFMRVLPLIGDRGRF